MIRAILLLCTVFLSSSNLVFASLSNAPENNPQEPNPKDRNDRPKAPTRKNVSVVYTGGYAYVTFASPEGVCVATVSVCDMPVQTVVFDSSDPMPIYIGDTDSATIAICTELGNTYYVSI